MSIPKTVPITNPSNVSYTEILICFRSSPVDIYFINSVYISDGLLNKNVCIIP